MYRVAHTLHQWQPPIPTLTVKVHKRNPWGNWECPVEMRRRHETQTNPLSLLREIVLTGPRKRCGKERAKNGTSSFQRLPSTCAPGERRAYIRRWWQATLRLAPANRGFCVSTSDADEKMAGDPRMRTQGVHAPALEHGSAALRVAKRITETMLKGAQGLSTFI